MKTLETIAKERSLSSRQISKARAVSALSDHAIRAAEALAKMSNQSSRRVVNEVLQAGDLLNRVRDKYRKSWKDETYGPTLGGYHRHPSIRERVHRSFGI